MIKSILGLLIIICLSSCGFKHIIIPNIDNAINHELSNGLDLYLKQQDQLDIDVKDLLNQLRPLVKIYLLPIFDELDVDNLAKLQISKLKTNMNLLFKEGSLLVSKIMAKNLKLLDENQWKHFKQKFEKENRGIEKRIRKYDIKLIQKRIEFFIGPLSPVQIEKLKTLTPILIQKNQQRLQNRQLLLQNITLSRLDNSKISIEDSLKQYNETSMKNFDSEASITIYQTIFDIMLLNEKNQNQELKKKLATAKEWLTYFTTYQY